MDVTNSVYNINLCEVCQIPNNLELISTSEITANGETYLGLLQFIFKDIPWTEDVLISLACHTCVKKIIDIAEFKNICLEFNRRKGLLKIDHTNINLKTEFIEVNDAKDYENGSPKIEDELTSDIEPTILENKEQQLTKTDAVPKSNRRNKTSRRTCRKSKSRPKKETTNCSTTSEVDKIDKPTIDNTVDKISKPVLRKPHTCDICQMQCKSLIDYDRHMNKHDGRRNYICSICGRGYITKTDLHQHTFRHSTEATHACTICPKKFRSPKDLRTHLVIVHTNKEEYKYICPQCGKKCSQMCTLKVHIMRAHTKVRNFKCDKCDKAFCDKGDLRKHYAAHSNIRAFKCDLCPAEYKLKPFLLVHKAKQHGIGNYKVHVMEKLDCSYCGKKVGKNKLARHNRTHTGERPYNCRLCGMKFICNTYIKGHLKSKHKIDVEAADYDTKSYYDVTEEPSLEDSADIVKNGVKE